MLGDKYKDLALMRVATWAGCAAVGAWLLFSIVEAL